MYNDNRALVMFSGTLFIYRSDAYLHH